MTGKSTPDLQAKCFECVAQEELQDIGTRRRRSIRPNVDVKKRADEAELFGVCLSGGGIRSATFALGVLQGLKGKCLLHKADYLSTVSGGGYIGAWLQGVVQRTKSFDALDPKASPEHKSVGFLRKYSNYLAARPGLSIDSTVIPVIWMRNAGLNQAIIIAAAFAAILACHIPGYLLGLTRAYWPLVGYGWPLAAYICAFCFGFLAVKRASSNLRGIVTANAPGDSPARIVYLVVIPLVLTALTLVIGIVKSSGVNGWLLFIASFLLHGALQSAGGFRECYVKSHKDEDYLWFRKHWHCVWMSAVSAGLACGLVYAVSLLLVNWRTNSTTGPYEELAWGPPLLLLVLLASVGLQIGLMGKDYPDAAREWLARAGAWVVVCAVGWAAIFAVAIFSPYWIMWFWASKYWPVVATTVGGWLTTTLAGVLAGNSAATGKSGGPGVSLKLDWIARYAPLVALPGFFVAIAYLVHAALLYAAYISNSSAAACACGYWPVVMCPQPLLPLMLLAAVVVFLTLSLRVNINEFSMHHFYKNRLVRCYLGASAESVPSTPRRPNKFTGFDSRDDLPLADLKSTETEPRRAPFPILNATLTVTQGSELATQERKAKSWIFTPLYSGFTPERSQADYDSRDELSLGGYIPTEKMLGGDLHIGTAMAISGAALNPGQGYHSSPPVAFLMTLFDARLGWWIGNPRNSETCTRPGPKIALWPLIRELFGELDERSPYLNLSDGGNFDNLGLYELVRRRCRFIIAVDAEEDHNFEFGALGAAVRKCRDDFQVEIDINPCPIRPSGDFSTAHCALGRIRYPGCAEFGYLLYIKASVTGDEPADVELYRRQFPEFPHQSTLDQFFTESQFESYRKLGLHCVESVFDFKLDENLHDVFERVADRWELPPAAPAGATSRQADAYTKLLDEWRKTDAVESFDSDLLESSASLFGEPKGRARHFLILDLLQLMETVFGECGLGRRENQLHRAYAGQMHVMRYWAGRTTFQEVWKTQRNNYAPAFQRFINDLMREAQTTPTNQNGNITTTDKE